MCRVWSLLPSPFGIKIRRRIVEWNNVSVWKSTAILNSLKELFWRISITTPLFERQRNIAHSFDGTGFLFFPQIFIIVSYCLFVGLFFVCLFVCLFVYTWCILCWTIVVAFLWLVLTDTQWPVNLLWCRQESSYTGRNFRDMDINSVVQVISGGQC